MPLFLPIPAHERGARFARLYPGLLLYGLSVALLVLSDLGLDPWDVLHQGIARRTGIAIGMSTVLASVGVLLLWIPLRQRPGLGTISNAVLVGLSIDASIALIPVPSDMVVRVCFLIGGIALNGLATGLYIGAGLGPGPRDGLMTGIAARGHSIRVVRTAIEVTVLGLGWLLGGTVGIGTVIYALAIGPIAHVTIPLFNLPSSEPALPPDARASAP